MATGGFDDDDDFSFSVKQNLAGRQTNGWTDV